MASSKPLSGDVASFTIQSDPACLVEVRGIVRQMAARCGFDPEDTDGIALAVDEALTNVIKHGYGGSPHGEIEVRLEVQAAAARRGLEIRIRDHGCQVDPASIQSRDLGEVRPGGLGVHIIRSIMDELVYECCPDGGMSVMMRKHVTEPGEDSAR